MTQVKICGLQEAAGALAAAHAGADFVGLVFVPEARRRLDEDRALRIVSTLREQSETPPKVVGLFVDQPVQEVECIVRRCGLDMVQLCGGEAPDFCGQISVPVIKALHVSGALAAGEVVAELSLAMDAFHAQGHMITLDRKVEGLPGGTGQTFDWGIAKALSMKGFHFSLAGGLTPENVGMAVITVRPWGVDVSSGVETRGVKDVDKIRAFIGAVRSAGLTEHSGLG